MLLDDCPDGTSLFVDASLLYLHFVDTPSLSERATAFLERIRAGDLMGHIAASALADVVHKVILAEAVELHGLPRAGLVRRLREHPELLATLTAHEDVVPEALALGLEMHSVSSADIGSAAAPSREKGLLTGDALIVAVMSRLGLSALATNDDDFERVSWLNCYLPR